MYIPPHHHFTSYCCLVMLSCITLKYHKTNLSKILKDKIVISTDTFKDGTRAKTSSVVSGQTLAIIHIWLKVQKCEICDIIKKLNSESRNYTSPSVTPCLVRVLEHCQGSTIISSHPVNAQKSDKTTSKLKHQNETWDKDTQELFSLMRD